MRSDVTWHGELTKSTSIYHRMKRAVDHQIAGKYTVHKNRGEVKVWAYESPKVFARDLMRKSRSDEPSMTRSRSPLRRLLSSSADEAKMVAHLFTIWERWLACRQPRFCIHFFFYKNVIFFRRVHVFFFKAKWSLQCSKSVLNSKFYVNSKKP